MAVPALIDDGDFSVAEDNGEPVPSFPFANVGDFRTFVYRVPKRIDASHFRMPRVMTQRNFPLGRGFLCDIDAPSLAGSRLYDYTEIYASVPAKRTEYGTASFTFQSPVASDPPEINSYTSIVDAEYLYEYSIFKPLPLIRAPEIILAKDGAGGSVIQFVGDWVPFENQRTLIQNTTSRIYMGQIYERLSILAVPIVPINAPT